MNHAKLLNFSGVILCNPMRGTSYYDLVCVCVWVHFCDSCLDLCWLLQIHLPGKLYFKSLNHKLSISPFQPIFQKNPRVK